MKTKSEKTVLLMYISLRVICLLLLVYTIIKVIFEKVDEYDSIYTIIGINTLGCLIISFAPSIIEKKWKIDIPNFIEVLFIIFCTGTFIIGESFGLYRMTTWWDAIMHTLSGSLITIFSFYLLDLLEKTNHLKLQTKPILFLFVVFCITNTIGVFWEIFEYLVDTFTGSNMQRYFNDIEQVDFIGQAALVDTMEDFILNSIGSLLIIIPGFFYLKKKKDRKKLVFHEEN